MTPDIVQVGVGCANAPLELRERMVPNVEQHQMIFDRLEDVAAEQATLSTCERLEWYGVAARGVQDDVVRTWAGVFALPAEQVHRYAIVRTGLEAARHLLRVAAAGLESRVVGENHILGQVRSAYRQANVQRSIGPVLSALWRTAIHTGKRVRTETRLGAKAASIAACAAEATRFDRTSGVIVILGVGKVARDVLDTMGSTASRRIVVVSRQFERAAKLAAAFGAEPAAMDQMPAILPTARAIVACTSSPRFIVTPDVIVDRGSHLVTIVDLGVPRNVDPAVGELRDVRLVHLESLAVGQADGAAVIEAHRIAEEELARFQQWRRHRLVARDIARLVLNAHAVDRRGLHRQIMRMKAEVAA